MHSAHVLWPAALGLVACGVFALRPGRVRTAAWLALLIAAQGATLRLYRAGPVVTYHHLKPDLASVEEWLALAVVLLQAVAVAFGLWRRRRPVGAFLRLHFRPWQALLLVVALAAISAKIARPAEAFAIELAAATLIHLFALGNVALAAAALSSADAAGFERSCARLLGPAQRGQGPEPGGIDRFALGVAAWAVAVPALLAWLVYQRHPHVPDEVVYLIHAEYLAQGRLWLPAPPVPAAFDVDLMLLSGERWFCPVPLGWPLALAAGAFLGAPWLVNPLLSGLGVLLVYALVRELAPRRAARMAILLLAASPWLLFLGMSYMTHAWSLACTALAALGVARSRHTGSLAWACAAGAALGMVGLIRPLDGLVLGILLGLWALGLGGERLRLGALCGLVLGALLVGGITLPYNAALTGDALRFPILEYTDATYVPGTNDLGFGPERGAGMDWRGLDPWPGHTPLQSLVNDQFNGFAVDAELFGWASGSLWLALLALSWRHRVRDDRLMWAAVAATVFASSFYYFAGGPDFGARYWYTVLVPCVWLAQFGLQGLEERLDPPRARLAVLLLCLSALLTFVPWRAADKYSGYRGMRPDVRDLARSQDFGRSLVLVRGNRHPDYASAAVYNPPDWDARAPIYAWDRDPEVRLEVLKRYADRPVWILEGPSVTGAGFRVAGGPLSAAEVLAATEAELGR